MTTRGSVASMPSETQSSEAESFDDFYASTAPVLVRQVHALTGDLAEAQDCVQEAYARAWQRWSTISEYGAPAAWVRTVACRLAISRFRRLKVGVGLLRRQGPPPNVPEVDASRVGARRSPQTDPRGAAAGHRPAPSRRLVRQRSGGRDEGAYRNRQSPALPRAGGPRRSARR